MKKQRKKYDKSFKQKAIELSEHRGSVPEIAAELGVNPDLIYRWRRELGQNPRGSFSGNGNKNLTPQEKDILQLKKRLRDAEEERDILKKAISIFSVSDGKSTNS